jgi:hypothetical protein
MSWKIIFHISILLRPIFTLLVVQQEATWEKSVFALSVTTLLFGSIKNPYTLEIMRKKLSNLMHTFNRRKSTM